MRTIFHANRKKLRGPRFATVFLYEGAIRYDNRHTRAERNALEDFYRQGKWWNNGMLCQERTPLYRVNVYPK